MNHKNPLISCIMPSYLYVYDGAAKGRTGGKKLRRAIDSFLKQTYKNSELILVSDGCPKTESIYEQYYKKNDRVRFKYVLRDGLFSGKPRNEGLKEAAGEIICYCDGDDYMTPSHLATLAHHFQTLDCDWVYFNDWLKNSADKENPIPREVEIVSGNIGIGSIAHRSELAVDWEGCDGRGHEWTFIRKLAKASDNKRKISAGGYTVCHVRGKVDL
jgi:glycosyltransferase involved in cell wall biosynthesis